MTTRQCDCLILGGGVMGLTLALELRQRGRSVTVLERGRVGREASWAGAGILPPPLKQNVKDSIDQLRTFSHRLHFELAERLRAETGIDTGLRRCGGIYVAGSAGETAALIGLKALYEEHGVRAERLSNEQLAQLEPQLAPAIANGRIRMALHCPDESQLRNPHHLQALAACCKKHDVQLLEGVSASRLVIENSTVDAVETSVGAFSAQTICVTTGAWSTELLQPLELKAGVFPVRGQMILYRCPKPPLTRILNEGPRYIVPRDDGHCLVGSSEEEVGFNKETTRFVQESLEQFASGLIGSLSPDRIEHRWSGLRPASFDSFPYIGQFNHLENLFIAAGHFRSGIHLSTGTARLVAQQICGEPVDLDLRPFSPNRG